MQENSLPPQNSNPSANDTDKKTVKGFTLLKMGVLEILFVGVVLFLFFGVLNYFNILSVSSAFPEQLGWLPRQKTISEKQLLYTPAKPTQTPTPISSSPDLEKSSRIVLDNLLKEVFVPNNAPKASDFIFDPIREGMQNRARWITKDIGMSVLFSISTDKESFNSVNIFYSILDNSTISETNSRTITSKYFSSSPKGTWQCSSLAGENFCENFWQETDGAKIGVGMQDHSREKDFKTITFCRYEKNSPNYSFRSCAPEFYETGILADLQR